MKRFLFDTWYGAFSVWCGALGLLFAAVINGLRPVSSTIGICTVIPASVLSLTAGLLFLAAWIVSLVQRNWKRALLQAAMGIGSLIGFGLLIGFVLGVLFRALDPFGPSEDHFADNLTIPPEIEADIIIPKDYTGIDLQQGDAFEDDFSRAIFAGLAQSGGDDPTVTSDLSALAELVHGRRPELMAYLARHPGWWLHEDRGNLCATRRWKRQGIWNHPLHGYYFGDYRPFNGQGDSETHWGKTHYQTRTTIGFPNSPFGPGKNASHPAASTIRVPVKHGKSGFYESCERFGDKAFCVEIFEQSSACERRITKTALAFLKDEFASLTNLPPDTVTRGPASFVLRNGMQPGIYNLTLRINPGEPGVTYLKAFEVTQGTRLSENRLEEASNERVGWSDDPEEKFLYENGFTLYEGDWGMPYAARIEVWFRPDSGKPERKLMERICKVEGWQR